MSAEPQPNQEPGSHAEIVDSISYLFGEGTYELRIPREINGKLSASMGWFKLPRQREDFARAALRYNDEHSVYITLNPISDTAPLLDEYLRKRGMRPGVMFDGGRSTRDEDIERRVYLPVDFDVKAAHDAKPRRSATEEELKQAVEAARACCKWLTHEMGIDRKSLILASSGNGAHVLVRVDLPNDVASNDLASDVLVAINTLFGGDDILIDLKVSNAARIWKVYGSTAHRGDATEDHPHRVARFLQMPAERPTPCNNDALHKIAALAPKAPPAANVDYDGPDVQFDIRGFVDRHFPNNRGWHEYGGGFRCILNQCCFDPAHTGSSVAMLQLSRGGIYYDCKHNGCEGKTWRHVRALLEPVPFAKFEVVDHSGAAPRTDGANALAVVPIIDEPPEMESIRESVAIAHATALVPRRHLHIVSDDPIEPGDHAHAARAAGQFTDVGNARMLVEHYGEDHLWCAVWKQWLTWQGTNWKVDDKENGVGLSGHELADTLLIDAIERGQTGKDAQYKHAQYSLSTKGQSSMLHEAKKLLPVSPSDFDRDFHKFNCRNGTLDLKTGTLRPHSREDRLMICSPVEYHRDATCPLWMKCLNDWMEGDHEMILYLQALAGYFLCGETIEQSFWIFLGPGSNGKSVFMETILEILGDYASTPSWSTFAAAKAGKPSYELATLKGKRLAITSELNEGESLNEGLVKQLTGGDTVMVRQIYGKPFLMRPQFKIIMYTNHMPKIRNADHGIWRRPKKVDWNAKIDRPDTLLRAKLRGEIDGIFRWMVDGFTRWQAGGLVHPQKVLDSTENYRQEQDLIGQWMEDCCVVEEDKKVMLKGLYLSFTGWCNDHGYKHVMPQETMGRQLTERGFQKKRQSNGFRYFGIAIRAQEEIVDQANQIVQSTLPASEGQAW